MSIQPTLGSYSNSIEPGIKDLPPPPEGEELKHQIAPNELYDFDVNRLSNINQLRERIRDATYEPDTIERWSFIIGDYISMGNKKIADHVAIFNIGSAHDCVNLGTEFCQVDEDECYAVNSETVFPGSLDYRRKQYIIWTHLDAVTFAKAFREHLSRKRSEVTTLRLNESGDFRTRGDIVKANEIARRIDDLVDTYTYSASSWFNWEKHAEDFVVNRSNDRRDYGARRFEVVDDVEEIPPDGLRCPHDESDGEIHCGDCRLCIDADAPDIYVKKFN
jgi:hypothetical protein